MILGRDEGMALPLREPIEGTKVNRQSPQSVVHTLLEKYPVLAVTELPNQIASQLTDLSR